MGLRPSPTLRSRQGKGYPGVKTAASPQGALGVSRGPKEIQGIPLGAPNLAEILVKNLGPWAPPGVGGVVCEV